jgi:ABC-type multidrug transport system fused ATPase/permease subunit
MPLQQWILLNIPTWVIAAVMLFIATGTAVGGVLLVRRLVDITKFKEHHDIAGPIFSTIGVIYAVMLAFVLVIVWQDFDKAQNNTVQEANYFAEMYRDTGGLSEPFRSQFIEANAIYIDALIKYEWPQMQHGARSAEAQMAADKVWELTTKFEPKTDREKIFFSEMLSKMNSAVEMRRQRIQDAGSGLHPSLWFVLLLGGIITVVFTFFFGSQNLYAQLTMTTMLAVLIVLILFTILIMDFPYSGDLSISVAPFQQVLGLFRR